MNEQDVIDLINQWIVENNNNEITANVLNPVLLAMIQQPNLLIGDLGDLATGENDDLVSAINWILTQISSGEITIHTGQNNPNETPPATYTVGDFYSQLDVMNSPLYLWQYTGTEWARISNYIDDSIEALDTTWSSHKISETIKGDRLDGNPTIVLDGNEITISGLSWWIQGNPYILIPPFSDTIPYTSEPGLSRKDIVVAIQANSLIRIPGEEGAGVVQPPQVPENTLLVTEFDVYHDSVGEPTEPIIGSQFIKKSFWYNAQAGNSDYLNFGLAENPRHFNIVDFFAPFNPVQGFDNGFQSGMTIPFQTQKVLLRNDTDEEIPLFNKSETAWYSFDFNSDNEIYLLKPGEVITFVLKGTVLFFVSSNVSDDVTADQISYDNSESGLEAENVQEAVDELSEDLKNIKLVYPPEFLFRPFEIYMDESRKFIPLRDLYKEAIESVMCRDIGYVSPSGNDSNEGTMSNPKRTIHGAYNAGFRTIYLSEGKFTMSDFNPITVEDGEDIILKGVSPYKTLIVGNESTHSWTPYNDIYVTSAPHNVRVIDYAYTNEYGIPSSLKRMGSIEEVENTPGSCFLLGSNIYVRLADDREPDDDVKTYLRFANNRGADFVIESECKIFVENIAFVCRGGNGSNASVAGNLTFSADGENDSSVFVKNCHILNSHTQGLRFFQIRNTYTEDCFVYGNTLDGIDYSRAVALIDSFGSNSIEINNRCINQGKYTRSASTSANINGSGGTHIGYAIRIGGIYAGNFGPNVSESGGIKSINLGVQAYNSISNVEIVNQNINSDFMINSSANTPGKSWYIGCYSEGSLYSFASVNESSEATIVRSKYFSPTVGFNISFLDNIEGNITERTEEDYDENNYPNQLAKTEQLSEVAFSGDYNDLDNLPPIPSIAGLATETYVDNTASATLVTANAYTDEHIAFSTTKFVEIDENTTILNIDNAKTIFQFEGITAGDVTLPDVTAYEGYEIVVISLDDTYGLTVNSENPNEILNTSINGYTSLVAVAPMGSYKFISNGSVWLANVNGL